MTRSAQTTAAIATRARPEIVVHSAGEPPRGWLSWLTTTDHKRIGLMYLIATFGFFLLGGSEALLLRLQLGSPNNPLISSDKYNAVMTMHGSTMVFLFVVPVWAAFANYMVP